MGLELNPERICLFELKVDSCSLHRKMQQTALPVHVLKCKKQKKCRDMSNILTFIQNEEEMSPHQLSNVDKRHWSIQKMSRRQKINVMLDVSYVCRQYQRHNHPPCPCPPHIQHTTTTFYRWRCHTQPFTSMTQKQLSSNVKKMMR